VSPLHYLILVMFMTAGAAVAQAISTLGHRRGLRRLAGRWQMHFAAADRLRLADRIAEKLPVLGAANVCVMDLLFCTVEDTHQYLFTWAWCVANIAAIVSPALPNRSGAAPQRPISP